MYINKKLNQNRTQKLEKRKKRLNNSNGNLIISILL